MQQKIAKSLIKAIDGILETVLKLHPRDRLVRDLYKLLFNGFSGRQKNFLLTAIADLSSVRGKFNIMDQRKYLKLLRRELGVNFARDIEVSALDLTERMYLLGYGEVADIDQTGISVTLSQPDSRAIKLTNQANLFWIKGHAKDSKLLREVSQTLVDGRKAGWTRGKIAQELQEKYGSLTPQTFKERYGEKAYWDLFAQIAVNRTSEIGKIQGLDRIGTKRYRLVVVLDDRTSAVCRQLAGKEFSVEAAKDRIDRYLSAVEEGDHDKSKEIMPWPNEYEDEDDIPDGLLPPFHGRCRTTIRRVA